MELSERQELLLHALIKEYLEEAEPISSSLLKQRCDLDVSPATIRNELQELTDLGYITQPHTSAGRVPTHKGYSYFIEITFEQNENNFLHSEIKNAREKIESELQEARKLMESLANISTTLSYTKIHDKEKALEIIEIVSTSKTTYDENIGAIRELIKKITSNE